MCKFLNTGKIQYLLLAFFIFVIDQFSKIMAISYLKFATPVNIFPGLNFTLVFNYGAAFSFLDNRHEIWQIFLFSTIAILLAIILLIWLFRLSKNQILVSVAIALILGGALGNLFDRLYYGYVIDFFDCYIGRYHWPVFNIADTAICIGAFLIIISSFRTRD